VSEDAAVLQTAAPAMEEAPVFATAIENGRDEAAPDDGKDSACPIEFQITGTVLNPSQPFFDGTTACADRVARGALLNKDHRLYSQ
jgi:hypothetical protein